MKVEVIETGRYWRSKIVEATNEEEALENVGDIDFNEGRRGFEAENYEVVKVK